MAMEKRMRILHGDLAQDKLQVGPDAPGGFRMITELNIMNNFDVLEHIKFAH